MPNKIPEDFHKVSIYDYHFIIKELVNEFDGQFECIGEKKEYYKTFTVPIKKGNHRRKFKKIIKMVTKVLKLYLRK